MPAETVSGLRGAPVVLTCEHASNTLPEPHAWADDAWLAQTHWAWDLGAAEVARALAAGMRAPLVLARASRLFVDVNRPADSATLFSDTADGRPVQLNQHLSAAERNRRLEAFYHPYHHAVDRAVAQTPDAVVLSIHSFTPVYEGGPPRAMELGVLFEHDEALAVRLAGLLAEHGFAVALNEPYSGRDGLMYSASRHAVAHGRQAVELEIRQDLAADPHVRPRVVAAIADAVSRCLPRGSS